jgi:hypothetical protein
VGAKSAGSGFEGDIVVGVGYGHAAGAKLGGTAAQVSEVANGGCGWGGFHGIVSLLGGN